MGSAFWLVASACLAVMGILNESEAETFQRFLNGARLWSWPNGRIQLGQGFPDLTVVNLLVREGLLDPDYQPTTAVRSALQTRFPARGLPHSTLFTADAGSR